MASRGGIEALLYLHDEAFRGRGIEGPNDSLLGGNDLRRHVRLGFG
jgi:hypothetical protein